MLKIFAANRHIRAWRRPSPGSLLPSAHVKVVLRPSYGRLATSHITQTPQPLRHIVQRALRKIGLANLPEEQRFESFCVHMRSKPNSRHNSMAGNAVGILRTSATDKWSLKTYPMMPHDHRNIVSKGAVQQSMYTHQ
ncbi:hypothetical protein [Bradyrhizobium sp. CCBAU 11361]|uniref:hypothetical protein n=1 Tax=Bradyrhizobium sp. CCBAU 11361 TaxID=1630812 RepID=UPI002303E3D5|nr:hypothetical protein [Bradyrhizobium sp. CCBAU 11361]